MGKDKEYTSWRGTDRRYQIRRRDGGGSGIGRGMIGRRRCKHQSEYGNIKMGLVLIGWE